MEYSAAVAEADYLDEYADRQGLSAHFDWDECLESFRATVNPEQIRINWMRRLHDGD